MFQERSTRVLHLLVPTTPAQGSVRKVVFSPEFPDTMVVLHEDTPPRIFDLDRGRVVPMYHLADRGRQLPTREISLADHELEKAKFGSACLDACYRPEQPEDEPELAVVFAGGGDEDTTPVYRLNPRTGKQLASADFFNGRRICYSHNGSLLAAGNSEGEVAVFGLLEDEPMADPNELFNGKVSGEICALCLQGDEMIRAATELNSLLQLEFASEDGESQVWQTSSSSGNGGLQKNMKLSSIVWSDGYGLLAYGGVGNDLWLVNPENNQGFHVLLKHLSRIRSLQFVDATAELLVFGDEGVELLPFAFIDEGREPFFENKPALFIPNDQDDAPIIGVHQYGNLMCVVHAVS